MLQGVVTHAGRLDACLADLFPDVSRSRAAQLIREAAVTVDGASILKPSQRIHVGSQLTLTLPEPVPDTAFPQDLPLDIVYQDDAFLVVNKAAGRVVHPGPGHPDGTLVNALLHHVPDLSGIGGVQRPGIVHRLDKGTSGLMAVAKSDRAHAALAAQFADHSAGRHYLAVCMGIPKTPKGTVRTHLARHPKDRVRWASTDGSFGRLAVTHYALCATAGRTSLIECTLETGRTHQVRVHLTESGWPIIGDPLYWRGAPPVPAALRPWLTAHPDRPLLHAWRLALAHPISGEPMHFTAPVPSDYAEALAILGFTTNQLPYAGQVSSSSAR